MRIPRTFITVLAATSLLATACSTEDGTDVAPAAEPAADEEVSTEDRELDLAGELVLEPSSGPAGTDVAVTGTGLPADSDFEVLWATADCDWVLEGEQREEYHGRACTPRETPVTSVATGSAGDLATTMVVPEDYGFAHDVLIVDTDGVVRNKAMFDLDMDVTVTPTSGPVGTPITIEVRGMGWQSLEDTRTILYDNRYVGFMSSVTTRGTARAVIPATGAPGPHRIEVNRGAYTFPYLNPDQSPRPDIPTFEATFTVTEGEAVLPPPVDEQNPTAVTREAQNLPTGTPAITTDVESAPTGTPFTVRGAGFEPGDQVTLQWFRIVGNRVSGQGWEERAITLTETTVAPDGSLEVATEIPGDVGGAHRIEAVVDDATLAETSVTITPQVDAIPKQFAWGDDLEIHLTGVGWTETANIYTIVYDNDYVGYACGFNTQGDVQIDLKATGAPGWHLVELYPAIYKGEETPGRNNFRIPQLTAADDHPGEDLPIFRLAFYIEP